MNYFITNLALIPKAFAQVTTDLGPATNLGDYVNLILDKIIPILGGIAFLVFIAAGYIYMTSQGDQTKVGLAKELIIGTITGILLLFLIGVLKDQIGF